MSYKQQSVSSSMDFTCLSKGRGFQFPPCHILNFGGIRIVLDCPLDLSALMAFSPVPASFDSKGLIFAEPWYKTVTHLHLWDASSIDIVLISSPMGIMGLPFLSRMEGFSAKIYVTEASARCGELMMMDLVSMHEEFRQFYGPDESNFPSWLRQKELEKLAPELREIILGKDGVELGGWMPLYSVADVKDCLRKIHTLKYAEEACYNGTLVIKAFSSGVEIGSCNWIINGPEGDIAYLSSSNIVSSHAKAFDYQSLRGTHALIYSDFSSLSDAEDVEDGENHFVQPSDKSAPMSFHDNTSENSEEKEKITYICTCALECVKERGSVLIPINQLGTSLQLLEAVTTSLDALAMKVPVYIISSVAEELLALLNIIPEWLCEKRQERLFAGEPLFDLVKLFRERKIHVVPALHSDELLMNWQEPCIVVCPHWSLRLGPVVDLLHRWCRDPRSLLILEDVLNPELALLPFQPVTIKVLQCLFPSGIGLRKIKPLLQTLQPKIVLLPEEVRLQIDFSSEKSFSIMPYTEGETSRVSCQKDDLEVTIAMDLASQFYWRTFKKEEINIARLEGKLSMENGRCRLLLDNHKKGFLESGALVKRGLPDSEKVLATLSKMGIDGSVEHRMSNTESNCVCVVRTQDPCKALIEIGPTNTVITTDEENAASLIYKVVDNILDGA